MKPNRIMLAGIVFLIAGVSLMATAQEKKLKKADLPAAVQKTADEQSKGATIKGYASEVENGQTQYEVELMVNGHSRDVTMAADGAVLEVEEQVEISSLPAAVREGLQKKAKAGKIAKVESITKHDVLVAYEAQVMTGGNRSEIQVGPDGKNLAHPE